MSTALVNVFNGGMVTDPRSSGSFCRLSKHFDVFTNKHSLVPYKGSEDAYASQTTIKIQSFLMYLGSLYGLGVVSGTGRAQINVTSAIDIPSWGVPTNGQDSAGTTNFELFVEYYGVLYGASAGTRIWGYDIAGTTFTATALSITYTNVAQGLVHSKDDILYIPYDNKIVKKDNSVGSTVTTGWESPALTLPANLIITSICEYGNYLAIACRGKSFGVNSVVYLWDRDSTLTTISESIDWGNNNLYQIENIEGYLIGVSTRNSLGSTVSSKMILKMYGGGGAIQFDEVESQGFTITGKQKVNNRMYFGVSATSLGGTTYDYVGVWSVGRNGQNEPFSVNIDRAADNDTLPQLIKGFYLINEYFYISYLDAGTGDFGLSKTDDQNLYATTSLYETVMNPGMKDEDKLKKKQLNAVLVNYEPLPTAAQVVLKYKVDSGSWVTVFTETTDSVNFTERVMAVSSQFTAGRDYEFRIESSGGAKITGLMYRYQVLPTQI